ncbi:hypothetical protein LWI29_015696 [Acer saccharum]|uniref:Uncharacterized protein n=1 Tax=Acer saccharum TaxID=4024 RepID=A0AA39RJC1_ACESA|nr:hypothetical protein LWI29_015696 [Acer saccharum]
MRGLQDFDTMSIAQKAESSMIMNVLLDNVNRLKCSCYHVSMKMKWHSLLFDYGLPEDGKDFAADDADANLVPTLMEKVAP